MRNFDKKYIDIAKIWASNSHAIRHKVGAIIVKNGMIISDGYNGTPNGFENECETVEHCDHSCIALFDKKCDICKEHKLVTKPYVLHAEANAILKKNNGAPYINILSDEFKNYEFLLSISHEKDKAVAFVVVK